MLLSWRCVTATTSPIARSWTSSVASAHGGAQRPFWFTASFRPACSAASTSACADSRSSASGFCASTCLPASSAGRISAGRARRVRRDVDDLDLGIGEQLVERAEHPDIQAGGRIRANVVNAHDVAAIRGVPRQVGLPHDVAAADDADPEPGAFGERGPVCGNGRHVKSSTT